MGNHKKTRLEEKTFADKLQGALLPKTEEGSSVSLSIVLPVFNCPEAVSITLESIKQQKYSPLEIIIIDAGSTDRTLERVSSYASLITRIYTVTHFNVADMMNRGISLAKGDYLSFLYPGTYYLSPFTFQTFSEKILERMPDLIYCGSIQREIKREPKTILLPYSENTLRKGHPFATTSACWFRSTLFDRFGKFNTHYFVRTSFDFFCRMGDKEVKTERIERIFVDFDYGRFSYAKAIRSAHETGRILCRHFGIKTAISWFFTLNHSHILKWLWSRFKLRLAKK